MDTRIKVIYAIALKSYCILTVNRTKGLLRIRGSKDRRLCPHPHLPALTTRTLHRPRTRHPGHKANRALSPFPSASVKVTRQFACVAVNARLNAIVTVQVLSRISQSSSKVLASPRAVQHILSKCLVQARIGYVSVRPLCTVRNDVHSVRTERAPIRRRMALDDVHPHKTVHSFGIRERSNSFRAMRRPVQRDRVCTKATRPP